MIGIIYLTGETIVITVVIREGCCQIIDYVPFNSRIEIFRAMACAHTHQKHND